jgi:hypothetical protein
MGLKIRKDGAWVNVSSKTSGSITAMASGAISAGDPIVLNSDGTVSKVSISTRITKLEEGPSTPYNGSNSQYDTYSWTVEDGITELSVVCIGGGGGGGGNRDRYAGGGAGLGHITMDVTPGDVIEYQVGAGGEGGYWRNVGAGGAVLAKDGGDTWLKNGSGTKVVSGGGGEAGGEGQSEDSYNGHGGTYTGDGGGSGGDGGNQEVVNPGEAGAGGGGAGGYAGNGGAGGDGEASTDADRDGDSAATDSGGSGGGAADTKTYPSSGNENGGGGGGGGTGILGKGSDGAGGETEMEGGYGGGAGSSGQAGQQGGEAGTGVDNKGGYGGYYGGGGGRAGGHWPDSPTKYGGDGGRGAIRIVGSGSNLTATNFLGFSEADYANNDTAAITIFSSIDKNQSGLLEVGKKYYVQDDGTLSTTPGHIRVEAGTALSSTNILVSGGAALKLEGTTRPFNTSGWKIPLVG